MSASRVGHRFEAEGDFVERLEGTERRLLIPAGDVVSNMGLSGSELVADLGSGIGYFSMPLARSVRRVLAVDVEPKMLKVLSSRVAERRIRNIDVLRAEITELPLAGGSVDHVLAAFVYHEVESPGRLLAESSRILREGGVLTILDFQKRETPIGPPVSERKRPSEVIRSAGRAFGPQGRRETDVYYQLAFKKK